MTQPSDFPAEKPTPMMAQYLEIKAANPDSLLFYRMGDFYELFFEDAETASRALGIVLTKRGRHRGEDIPMCGVPVERADDYLQRLIALGHRVAVCEQLEDPAEARKRGAKSVVRRDVTRLVTPGTITEERLLDPARASLLLSVARTRAGDDSWQYGLASIDLSTGAFLVCTCNDSELAPELARIDPKEIVIPDSIFDDASLKQVWRETAASVTPIPREGFDGASGERLLTEFFGVATLDGFGQFTRAETAAAAAALSYIARTQKGAKPDLSPPRHAHETGVMRMDAATRANLELMRTLAGERAGSLLATIDRTVTPAGARLLAERLSGPLTDPAAIHARLDAVDFFIAAPEYLERTRAALKATPDGARALARLALNRGGPRDLDAVRGMILVAGDIARDLADAVALPDELRLAAQTLAALDQSVAAQLGAALADELPLNARDGGFIREGYNAALDELRLLGANSRKVIAQLQARLAMETDTRTLRIKHNNFLGFFIEVPPQAGELFLRPPHNAQFIHRQTMQGAMRFTTAELGELEQKIASAGDRALHLEQAEFETLTKSVLAIGAAIKAASHALAVIDVASAHATLSLDWNWTRPHIGDDLSFAIEAARHPVVEAALKRDGQPFVSNGVDLSPPPSAKSGAILVMTGPNMAGKSTYLRQAALIAILAQSGSHVPAARAHIGIVDRLFSRVGAADDLARGRSTFMVEMIETAAILNQATERSLVILDEIGRGTATFDGLSIAWATIEQLHDGNRCRALFATHFHELTQLAKKLPRLANASMRVTEFEGDVIFLHEVMPGAADRSYGIQVAKLAGLPPQVVARARTILSELEASERAKPVSTLIDDLPLFSATRPAPAPAAADPVAQLLAALHPDEMTPREALEALYALKKAGR